MRIANLSGRLSLVVGGLAIDVAEASGGTFGPDVQAVYQGFAAFRSWAQDATLPPGRPFDPRDLGAPAPSPRQLFAIGLNYRDHARESGFTPPPEPAVFTKFVSSITGPVTEVELPDGQVDWEVELVVVIGAGGRCIAVGDAWSHVAGLTVGQDISERVLQRTGTAPQFSLASSSKRDAAVTSSSVCPSSSRGSPRSCPYCPATSSTPAPPPEWAWDGHPSASSAPARCSPAASPASASSARPSSRPGHDLLGHGGSPQETRGRNMSQRNQMLVSISDVFAALWRSPFAVPQDRDSKEARAWARRPAGAGGSVRHADTTHEPN